MKIIHIISKASSNKTQFWTLITYFIQVLTNKSSFYAVNQKQYKVINTQASNKAVCLISFALDQKTIEYERTVYSFMDMFGFLGGLYDFLYFCGYFCIAFFQTRLFDYTVFSGLYHLEVESKEDNHEEKTAGQLESMIRAMPGMIKSQDNINNE